MRFTREEVEDSLAVLRLPDYVAREFVDDRVLVALDDRLASLGASRSGDRYYGPDQRDIDFIVQSTLVTYSLLAEIRQEQFYIDFPSRDVENNLRAALPLSGAIGMIAPWQGDRRVELGVSLKLDFEAPRVDVIWRELTYTRLSAYFPRLQASLPLRIEERRQKLHDAPHLVGATSACYARAGDSFGMIAAGHSVRESVEGDAIPLDVAPAGRLVHSVYRPIDAAFIELDRVPEGLRPLRIHEYPSIDDRVNVMTRRGALPRQVAQVNSSLVTPYFTEYPAVIFLDRGCEYGDSGSLIRLADTGEAVGIYTGEHDARDPRDEPLGTAQHFAQAMYALHAEPLE